MKTLKKLFLLIGATMMLGVLVSCSHDAGTENGGGTGTGTGTQTTPVTREYPAVFDGFQPMPELGEGAGMRFVLTFNADNTWVLCWVNLDRNEYNHSPYTITIITPGEKGTYRGDPFFDGLVTLVREEEYDSLKQPDYSTSYNALYQARQDATLLVDDTLMNWKDYEGDEPQTTIAITNGTTSFENADYTIRD